MKSQIERFRILLVSDSSTELEKKLQPFLQHFKDAEIQVVHTEAELKQKLTGPCWNILFSQFQMKEWDIFDVSRQITNDLPMIAIGEQVSGEMVARFMEQSPQYRYAEMTNLKPLESWLEMFASHGNAYADLFISQKQQEYFFRMLDANIVGVQCWHLDGRILDANQTFLDMVGYTREEFEQHGLSWREISPPESKDSDDEAVRQLRQYGRTPAFEKQYIRKNGSTIDVLLGSLYLDSENSETGIALILDISELKANKQKLEEIQRNLLSAQYIAKIGSWDYNTSDNVLYCSEEFYRIMGVPSGTSFNTRDKFLPYVYPDDRASWERALDTALQTGKAYSHEYRIIRPDGEMRYIQAQGEVTFNEKGELLRMCGTAQDITERKQADEALMLLTVQQEALLNNIPDLVWMKDSDGNFIAMNELGAKFLNSSREEVVGKPLSAFMSKEYADRHFEIDQQVMETGQRISMEDPIQQEDGKIRWMEIIRSPIFNSEGELIGLTGTGRDITQRKEYDEALLLSRELLEKKVAERTKELEAANRTLKENERLRSTFVSSLTHDLRTPLIAQTRLIELLLGQCQHDNEKMVFLSQGLMKNNENLLDMVNKLLETYQYAEGQILLHREPVNLQELVDESQDILKEMALSKDITLLNQVPDLAPIMVDRSLVKRVFINLLGNAVENISQGCKVEVSAKDLQGIVQIEVKDNGSGIDAEFLPHLFRRYAPRSRRRQKLGSGLGLFICKAIVELHHGTITATSEPGEGATFTVSLPRQSIE